MYGGIKLQQQSNQLGQVRQFVMHYLKTLVLSIFFVSVGTLIYFSLRFVFKVSLNSESPNFPTVFLLIACISFVLSVVLEVMFLRRTEQLGLVGSPWRFDLEYESTVTVVGEFSQAAVWRVLEEIDWLQIQSSISGLIVSISDGCPKPSHLESTAARTQIIQYRIKVHTQRIGDNTRIDLRALNPSSISWLGVGASHKEFQKFFVDKISEHIVARISSIDKN